MKTDHAQASDLVGVVSGRKYVREQQIGDGALGAVHAAREIETGERYAVKLLVESPIAGVIDRLGRLQADLDAAAHPAIVKLVDFGRADGCAFIVTRICDGHSAEDALDHGPLSPGRVAAIGRQLAVALAVAHAAGVSHQAVSPSSVMLDPDGGVRLLGIGLLWAITAGDAQAIALLQTDKQVLETSISFVDRADPRADVHGLGGLLAHLLTGHRPYALKIEQILAQRGATRAAPIISRLNPSVPPELEDIVQRALSPHPRARYKTMLEFSRALDTLVLA